jgi:hypothetical protein
VSAAPIAQRLSIPTLVDLLGQRWGIRVEVKNPAAPAMKREAADWDGGENSMRNPCGSVSVCGVGARVSLLAGNPSGRGRVEGGFLALRSPQDYAPIRPALLLRSGHRALSHLQKLIPNN